MKIITNPFQHSINDKLCAALGYFDGFHMGHMRLIGALKESRMKSAVITFSNRPSDFIKSRSASCRIMSLDDKISFLEKYGIDYLFMYEFDSRMMNTSAEDFVRDFLYLNNVKRVVAGFNYTFGKGAEGDTKLLVKLGNDYGIKVDIIGEVLLGGSVVSSSMIRSHLTEGNIPKAAEMLGRPYTLSGKIAHTLKPDNNKVETMEITLPEELIIPKSGYYDTIIHTEGLSRRCLTVIEKDFSEYRREDALILEGKGEGVQLEFVGPLSMEGRRAYLDDALKGDYKCVALIRRGK